MEYHLECHKHERSEDFITIIIRTKMEGEKREKPSGPHPPARKKSPMLHSSRVKHHEVFQGAPAIIRQPYGANTVQSC